METRKQLAIERKKACNCAQAVIATYADLASIDEETAMALGSAFGSGMGNMEGTCGALTGAAIVLGLVKRDKLKARKPMINIMKKFQERNGATQCKLLKGVGTGKVLRSCEDCVGDACGFLEEEISKNNFL
ncbi:MAG: C_GCAxxG_C_C family protein [Muribaculaceae bacterium]|nr:C_GCAxxG_C_C family protein [Muribaculaceae bacterium]